MNQSKYPDEMEYNLIKTGMIMVTTNPNSNGFINMDSFLNKVKTSSDKMMIIVFSPRCGHCIQMFYHSKVEGKDFAFSKPNETSYITRLIKEFGVTVYGVNGSNPLLINTFIESPFNVKGFPTILVKNVCGDLGKLSNPFFVH